MVVRFSGGEDEGSTEKNGGTVVVNARRRRDSHKEKEEEGSSDIVQPDSFGIVNVMWMNAEGTTAAVKYAWTKTAPSDGLSQGVVVVIQTSKGMEVASLFSISTVYVIPRNIIS
eukprot:CAMPEP_0194348388 /NCGR_PEP_ID=MMETSP0171-20130528/106509_1 /TAXON_ID=218684 /ORGANISM="Corethron pennatum, Strain L29A3" /LENGTH=113 /DNA_ID=CAMNT_0039115727 /DNA_START=405 /DNA_END=744 /DNA_ORIENTATION=+